MRASFVAVVAISVAVLTGGCGGGASTAQPNVTGGAFHGEGAEWIQVESEEDGFQARFPAPSERATDRFALPGGLPPILINTFQCTLNGATYLLQVLHFNRPDISPTATVEGILAGTRDGMLQQSGATLKAERWIEHMGWPALEVDATGHDPSGDVSMSTRLVLVGSRQYNLMVFNADGHPFFDAFVPSDPPDAFRIPSRAGSTGGPSK